MTYPCPVIRDLLPLYLDEVLSPESTDAVEQHLAECEGCRQYCEQMRSGEIKAKASPDEHRTLESLKRVKAKLSRRTRRIIAASLAGALLLVGGYYALFEAAFKSLTPADVSMTASVYPMAELRDDSAVPSETASFTFPDGAESYYTTIVVPGFGDLSVTADVTEKEGYVTVVTWSSDYFLRVLKYGEGSDPDTLYITDFKTSILGNKAQDYQKSMSNLEFRKFDRIVYLEKNGAETVLWEAPQA